jgi:hypothetical protein
MQIDRMMDEIGCCSARALLSYLPSINRVYSSSDRYVCRHNDLPYNLYQKLSNNLSAFHFDSNLRNDVAWGSTACRSCYTDLPRLIEGKVGGQVSHGISRGTARGIDYRENYLSG